MPIEMVDMSQDTASDDLRLAIVGAQKHGKSRLAATGRKNVLFLDFDRRRKAVAGFPGVYAITFNDSFYPTMPDAAPLALDILSQLEKSLDLHDLEIKDGKGKRYAIEPRPPVGTFVRTIVNDSMSSLADSFRNYEMYMNKDLRREISIGVTKSYFPNGWDTWNAETSQVVPFILRQFGLGIDVIAVFHEALEKSEDSTSDSPKYTGKVSIYPPRYEPLIKYFSEVWRVRLASKPTKDAAGKTVYRFTPQVYPLPDNSFTGATAMLLDPEEEPNIEKIIEKHESRKKFTSSPQVTSEAAKQLKTEQPKL